MNHNNEKVAQYQRAVTPTLEGSIHSSGGSSVRGKVFTYGAPGSTSVRNRMGSNLLSSSGPTNPVGGLGNSYSLLRSGLPPTTVVGNPSTRLTSSFAINNTDGVSMSITGKGSGPSPLTYGNSFRGSTSQSNNNNSISTANVGIAGTSTGQESLTPLSVLPRYDLEPLSDEIPADGIIFAKIRNVPDSMVAFRTPEERLRNPERLNLDRRQLIKCPILEQEQRLRLLNYQNNQIQIIENLENLPNLIFLDFYNNKLTSLSGPLPAVRGLRVLMAGKNKISAITNLKSLKKLDVLDLHSNDISTIENLDELHELRVLNLAGNKISLVSKLTALTSLTELNLRRNQITSVAGLDQLPALQRIFLSHNQLATFQDVHCVFQVKHLLELSLDGNPLTEDAPPSGTDNENNHDTSTETAEKPHISYRQKVIMKIPTLKHLDLKRVTDEERIAADVLLSPTTSNASSGVSTTDGTGSGHNETVGGLVDTTAGGDFDLSSLKKTKPSTEGNISFKLYSTKDTVNEEKQLLMSLERDENQSNDRQNLRSDSDNIEVNGGSSKNSSNSSNNTNENSNSTTNNQINSSLDASGSGGSSGPLGNGITMLAKKGQLPKGMSHIDIEDLSASASYHQNPSISGDKALVCVGDTWDWSHLLLVPSSTTSVSTGNSTAHTMISNGNAINVSSIPATVKRLLAPVTEIILVHSSRDISVHRLFSNSPAFLMASFPQLQSISIVHCPDILRVADLDPIIALFQQVDSIRHVSITGDQTPILFAGKNSANSSSTSTDGDDNTLRSYVIAQLPRLIRFNNCDVMDMERQAANQRWSPLLSLKRAALAQNSSSSSYSNNTNSNTLISPMKRGSLGGLGSRVGPRLGNNTALSPTPSKIKSLIQEPKQSNNNYANNTSIGNNSTAKSKSFAALVQQLYQLQPKIAPANPPVTARNTRPQTSMSIPQPLQISHSSASSALLDRDAFNQDINQEVRQSIVTALRALQYQHPLLYSTPPAPAQLNDSTFTNNY